MIDLLINPSRLGSLIGDLIPRIKAAAPDNNEPASVANGKAPGFEPSDYETTGGVAVIPVRGGLVSAKISGWRNYSATTYEGLVATIEKAVADPSVAKILLSFMSPGGTAIGCAEAAAMIDMLSEKKPIWSYCAQADSGAYWLAAATNKIIVDPVGEVGSVGVIMTHMDVSQVLDKLGVKMTHIFSGAHKADGSPYMPLTESATARLQGDTDYLREVFVGSVAALRGMEAEQVHGTEALTYKGQQAVDAGLADETALFPEVLKQMAGRSGSSIILKTARKKEISMAKTETTAPKDPAATAPAQPAPAATAATEAVAPVVVPAPAATPAAADQKARISGIINHPEAAGRTELAKELAFGTDLSAEDAGKLLAKAPKEAATAAANPLAEAMRQNPNPQIGAGGDSGAVAKDNPLLASVQQNMQGRLKKKTA